LVIHQPLSVGGEPTLSVLSPTPAPNRIAVMPASRAAAMWDPQVMVEPLLEIAGSPPRFVAK
jgi:hypothetical protein